MMSSSALATCIFLAAQTYGVPPAVLVGILEVEGGKVGQEVRNTNNTYDLGPMQINTIWLPELAKHWGVSEATARRWVRDDGCVNIGVGAWILRQKSEEAGSIYSGIAHYHSKTPRHGIPYRQRVFVAMQRKGLLKTQNSLR